MHGQLCGKWVLLQKLYAGVMIVVILVDDVCCFYIYLVSFYSCNDGSVCFSTMFTVTAAAVFVLACFAPTSARTFTVYNNCPFTIWYALCPFK